MPLIGIGIHVLIALFFAVHAIRTQRELYWLIILFTFPLLGSVVYFAAIYLPATRLERSARLAMAATAKLLDPSRALREAQAAFDYAQTTQNQLHLAAALLDAGQPEDAIRHYEACINGKFGAEPDILMAAARACEAAGRHDDALRYLDEIRTRQPEFQPLRVAPALARSLTATGQKQKAREEFERALDAQDSFDVRGEYFIWAASVGDHQTATTLDAELVRTTRQWDKYTRSLNRPLLARIETARRMLESGRAEA